MDLSRIFQLMIMLHNNPTTTIEEPSSLRKKIPSSLHEICKERKEKKPDQREHYLFTS